MPSLVVMKGPGEGDFHRLEPGTNIIGRAVDLPFHLLDMTVSRRHLRIECDADSGRCTATDLGSTHGVLLNGLRLRENMELVDGDCLSVGLVDLVFTEGDLADREQAYAYLAGIRPESPTMNYAASSVAQAAAARESLAMTRLTGLRRWAGATKATMAVVFTDIVGSTLLNHELGDGVMDELRRTHYSRIRRHLANHGGYEIKTSGDGFMIAFRTAVAAVDFGLEARRDTGDLRLRLRAGAHVGPVVVEQDDVQGAAVSYCARLVEMAADGGFWVSDEVKRHLDQEKAPQHRSLSWSRHAKCEVRGFPGPHLLWSLPEGA